MNPRTNALLDELMDIASERITAERNYDRSNAWRVYSELLPLVREAGTIHPVSDSPEIFYDDTDTLADEVPLYQHSYAIDGGSFPAAIDFGNGISVNATLAAIGENHTTERVSDLHKHRHLVVTAYTGHEEYNEAPAITRTFTGPTGTDLNYRANFIEVPLGHSQPSRIHDWVSTTAQRFAEGRHLANYVSEFDGPVFIDGPLYPIGVLDQYLFTKTTSETVSQAWQECATDIIQLYVSAVSTQYTENNAFPVGITKTTTTSALVETIKRKQEATETEVETNWRQDREFITDLLSDPEHMTDQRFAMTSWFEETGLVPSGANTEKFEPLADFDFPENNPEDFRRAFFYVRLPRSNHILRVETPAFLVTKSTESGRRRLQRTLVRELAEERDVPRALKHADSNVTLPRSAREEIKQHITGSPSIEDYNTEGRWTHLGASE